VRCSLTGQEMPCREDSIEAYIGGKRFQRLSRGAIPLLDPAVYKDFLIPSNRPGHERQLFCKITLRHLNNLPHHIAQHVNGRRFQKSYERWKQCQLTGAVFQAVVGRTKQRLDASDESQREGKKMKQEDDNDDDDDDNDSLSICILSTTLRSLTLLTATAGETRRRQPTAN
jgi:hypothetical protein